MVTSVEQKKLRFGIGEWAAIACFKDGTKIQIQVASYDEAIETLDSVITNENEVK